jgi:hypothetical protein
MPCAYSALDKSLHTTTHSFPLSLLSALDPSSLPQLICEAYQLMKDGLGMSCDEMSAVFGTWNKTELDSFLIEITTDILAFKDTDGKPLVEKIRDAAGQKGTGKWTAISALDKGMPVTLIGKFTDILNVRFDNSYDLVLGWLYEVHYPVLFSSQ